MSRMCSVCGRLSQDPEFCDHCNADLGTAGQSLPPERCPVGPAGTILSQQQRHMLLFPDTSITLSGPDGSWRVHWISDYDWRERGAEIEKRQSLSNPSLPCGQFLDAVAGRWVVFRAYPDQVPAWPTGPRTSWLEELARLSAQVHSMTLTLESLHRESLVWLNFDPNALEEVGPVSDSEGPPSSPDWRALQILNLDIKLYPFGFMPERVRVHPHYAAPEIVQFRARDIGPRTDVFHLAVFTYYWIAGLLPDGLPGDGLEKCNFVLPSPRVFVPDVPEGILGVIQRGLALNPADRFATPRAFAHALDEAVIAIHKRRAFTGSIQWDVGAETRPGRAKAEIGRGNEDAILVRADDKSVLALVADGVSTCDIGSGGLASMMTTIVIENAFADGCTHDTFPEVVTRAAQRGSQGLLDWAIAHDCKADLEAGKDLMGTTLTVAWIEGREVSIANLGDSRAYLVTPHLVEQLTVDGDLASDLLARGASPEEIRELGSMARALRECVGGCVRSEDGEVAILTESSTPRISRWPIVPGDVLVLCTDGLVEEGFFLDPEDVATIVRRNRDRSAAELAHLLVEAADSLQRSPTIFEPDGFGDNIACVVVKIKG